MREGGQMFMLDGIVALLIIMVIIWVAISMEMSIINEFKNANATTVKERKMYEELKNERDDTEGIFTFTGSID